MRNELLFILILSFSVQAIGENLVELKPSKATLTMDLGEMEIWLEKTENNIWEMGSKVDGGRLFQREEISAFELNQNSLIPLDHRRSMKILFRGTAKSFVNFDWKNLTLDYQEGENKGSITLIDGTLGPATAQLKMRLDLRSMDINALPERISYFVYFKGEIKERTYILKGFEDIETPLGTFNTLKVEREFLPEEDREQIYWFAPELDFSIARILDTNDGRTSDLLLKSLEFVD